MNLLVELSAANALKWKRPASPFIVGMFHDLCKIDQYRGTCCKDGALHDHIVDWEYNPNTLFKGHGDKSIILLSQFLTLTDEEVACIRYHMGAFTEKKNGGITPAPYTLSRMSCGRTKQICLRLMW